MNRTEIRENCTIDTGSSCGNCSLSGALACKFDIKTLKSFMAIGFPPVLLALFGLSVTGLVSGHWWPLVGYVVFTFGMLGALEMFFLCRHCPFYADDGKSIVCNGNYGSLKLMPYDSSPMNSFERFCMRAFVALSFFILPLSGLGFGIYTLVLNSGGFSLTSLMGLIGISFGCLLSSTTFLITLKTYFCTKCVNFSCPLNRVPRETVDDYLNKNKVMKEVWASYDY